MRSVAFCLVALLQISVNCAEIIAINGGTRGDWGVMDVCPEGTLATGFRLKVEENQGCLVDDTALNAIRLYCTKNTSKLILKEVTSRVGDFGEWERRFFCRSGFLKRFSLRVGKSRRDYTGANKIKFQCSSSEVLEGDGLDWGHYDGWSRDCAGGICGIRTRVEGKRGMGRDNMALNDVHFLCCRNPSNHFSRFKRF